MRRDLQRPPPTGDLDSAEEIAEMVRRFYQDVAQDDLLGPVFNDVAAVDWSEHLPKLTAFWCRALLDVEGYVGNPFRAHALIHQRSPFTAAHFERWLELFHDAVELGWTGPNADRALALAHNVARVHSKQLIGPAVEPVPRPAPPPEQRRARRPPELEEAGDPPCWQGSVTDHRDRPLAGKAHHDGGRLQ